MSDRLDKYQMAKLIGIPPRAVARWLRARPPIPHDGHGDRATFDQPQAIAWMVEHVPAIRPRLAQMGLV